ncbi:hypothetical protein [Mesorhizobium mediterraneum]|uniref:hypothetical protein n=1 Tax=Mesorhizobium mediterraneum TaxID=43617 RepID=UPI00177ADF85
MGVWNREKYYQIASDGIGASLYRGHGDCACEIRDVEYLSKMDTLSVEQRRSIMKAVRREDTAPEIVVRRLLRT